MINNMSVKDLFNHGDKAKRMSHVRNLIALAGADGHVSDDELLYISRVAGESGMTEKELKQILGNPEKIKFVVPKKDDEKIAQLYDLVLLMMTDGELDGNEVAFCRLMAMRLGLSPLAVDVIVNNIIDLIESGVFFDDAIDGLLEAMSKL